MTKYCAKPRIAEVDAMQWIGTTSRERRRAADRIIDWINKRGGVAEYCPVGPRIAFRIPVVTADDWSDDFAAPGDYIVSGDVVWLGELPEDLRAGLSFWVCPADEFEARYEAAT